MGAPPGSGVAEAGKPAWNRLKPAKYEVHGCTYKCSVSEVQLGAELAKTFHGWYEQGLNDRDIGQRSDQVGHHVSYGALGRHRANHLVRIPTVGEADPLAVEPLEKVDHIAVLEQIIAIGASKIPAAKMTPDVVLKAMELHYKYTQGRALEDTFAAISAAMAGAGMEGPTEPAETDELNREAMKTPDELAAEMAALG